MINLEKLRLRFVQYQVHLQHTNTINRVCGDKDVWKGIIEQGTALTTYAGKYSWKF